MLRRAARRPGHRLLQQLVQTGVDTAAVEVEVGRPQVDTAAALLLGHRHADLAVDRGQQRGAGIDAGQRVLAVGVELEAADAVDHRVGDAGHLHEAVQAVAVAAAELDRDHRVQVGHDAAGGRPATIDRPAGGHEAATGLDPGTQRRCKTLVFLLNKVIADQHHIKGRQLGRAVDLAAIHRHGLEVEAGGVIEHAADHTVVTLHRHADAAAGRAMGAVQPGGDHRLRGDVGAQADCARQQRVARHGQLVIAFQDAGHPQRVHAIRSGLEDRDRGGRGAGCGSGEGQQLAGIVEQFQRQTVGRAALRQGHRKAGGLPGSQVQAVPVLAVSRRQIARAHLQLTQCCDGFGPLRQAQAQVAGLGGHEGQAPHMTRLTSGRTDALQPIAPGGELLVEHQQVGPGLTVQRRLDQVAAARAQGQRQGCQALFAAQVEVDGAGVAREEKDPVVGFVWGRIVGRRDAVDEPGQIAKHRAVALHRHR